MIKTKHPITNREIMISQNLDGFYIISMNVDGTTQYMSEDLKWARWQDTGDAWSPRAIYSSAKMAQSYLDMYLKNLKNLKHPIKESAIDRILEAI
jgi:hypothetical protein